MILVNASLVTAARRFWIFQKAAAQSDRSDQTVSSQIWALKTAIILDAPDAALQVPSHLMSSFPANQKSA